MVSETDFFLSPHHNSETVHRPPKQKTVFYDYILDYAINTRHPASKETVPPSQAIIKNIDTAKPDNFSHSVIISSPIVQSFPVSKAPQIQPSPSPVPPAQVKAVKAQPVPLLAPRAARAQHVPTLTPIPRDGAADAQPTPIPVPAPRVRAARTQSTPAPVPVSQVGVTSVQLAPIPVPAPKVRVARIPPDLPRAEALQPLFSHSGGSEELACPPASTTSSISRSSFSGTSSIPD